MKESLQPIYDFVKKHESDIVKGNLTDPTLADRFGVSVDTIRRVRRNSRIKTGAIAPRRIYLNPENPLPILQAENSLLKKQLSEALQKNSLVDQLTANILEVIPTISKYPIFAPQKKAREPKPEEWILLISDVQLGQKLGKEETGGLGEYNYSIFKKRIAFLLDSMKHVVSYHVNPPNTLKIFFLGDIIEGSTIFKGQQRQIDLNTIDQVTQGMEHFSQFVYELARIFPEVKCYGVPGNHGRIGDKGEGALMDNLDILTYRWIQDRIIQSKVKNVSFDISKSWYQLVYVNGWVFLLEHGDSFKGWGGIPFYGAQRAKMNFQDLLQDYQLEFVDEDMKRKHLEIKEKFHYVTFADKHVEANFRNIFMNGCWPSGSELSLKYMHQAGLAQQTLISVSREYGAVWKRPLYLMKPRSEARHIPLYS